MIVFQAPHGGPKRYQFLGNFTFSLKQFNVADARRFTNHEGKYAMNMTCFEDSSISSGAGQSQLQWLHMQRKRMNLGEFRDFAWKAPNLSAELRVLVLQLFEKLQTSNKTKFFDGHRMDPGTVLQCNGSTEQTSDQANLSVTFLCFPYLSLRQKSLPMDHSEQTYPIRTLSQTLYPHEPAMGRTSPPAFCKGLPKSVTGILYVPHLWAVVIGSRYLLTCSECNVSGLTGNSIVLAMRPSPIVQNSQEQGTTTTPFSISHRPAVDLDIHRGSEARTAGQSILVEQQALNLVPGNNAAQLNEQSSSLAHPVPGSPSQGRSCYNSAHSTRRLRMRMTNMRRSEPSDHGLSDEKGADLTSQKVKEDTNLLFYDIRMELKSAINSRFHGKEKPFYEMFILSTEPHAQQSAYYSTYVHEVRELVGLQKDLAHLQRQRHSEIMHQLEQGKRVAKVLEALEELETQNQELPEFDFRKHQNHRDDILRTLDLEDRSLKTAIRHLADTIESAFRLVGEIMDRKLHFLPSKESAVVDHGGTAENRATSLPFLVWGHSMPPLEPGFAFHRPEDAEIHAKRAELNHILPILDAIDRSILSQRFASYSQIRETDIQQIRLTIANRFSELATRKHDAKLMERPSWLGRFDTTTSMGSLDWMLNNVASSNYTPFLTLEILTTMNKVVDAFDSFLALFVPSKHKHRVMSKAWGAIKTTLQIVVIAAEEAEPHRQAAYVIRHTARDTTGNSTSIKNLPGLVNCSSCQSSSTYRTTRKAVEHLRREHQAGESGLDDLSWFDWICTVDQLRRDSKNERHLFFLQTCLSHLEELCDGAKKFHAAVTTDGHRKSEELSLPRHLVRCLEGTISFILQAAVSIANLKNVQQGSLPLLHFQQAPSYMHYALHELTNLARAAQQSLADAEKAFSLPNTESGMVDMSPASPEFLVALICQNLRRRRVVEGLDSEVNGLYQAYTSRLKYQVHKYPRKRLLREIHDLQDELTAVTWVNEWQQDAYSRFAEVMNPRIYRPSTAKIPIDFVAVRRFLRSEYRSLRAVSAELEALDNAARMLRDQLKESMEILEEDHGKAIMVFTTITTIFLPLSFVTSFFGMNTVDIRDTNRTQRFFWVIAVPVTASIVGIAVFIAYYGGQLYDMASIALQQLREDTSHEKIRLASAGQELFRRIEEKEVVKPQSLRQRLLWKRKERASADLLP
ncbi:hypothetical protein CC80DRAFT_491984 [Byssothecium circinans]|uniref:DUF7896 domain-containing protein n=1 Tax=Byssothecium circinans TaxID=147558 RepID=A0A6A5TYP3_9PLEO|nr:hypothetical protein CC80DRAFT_491984 [Byssothecium circinans]